METPQTPPSTFQPKTDRSMAMLCHLASFSGWILPFGHLLGPLIVWLLKKEDPEVDAHGKASLNFQITSMLFILVLIVVGALTVGIPFFGLLSKAKGTMTAEDTLRFGTMLTGVIGFAIVMGLYTFYSMVIVIVNSIRAYDGKPAKYWPSIRFVR